MLQQLQRSTINARVLRPDLPMIGVNVDQGIFNIVCFPDYGKCPRSEWHRELKVLREGLDISGVITALQNAESL